MTNNFAKDYVEVAERIAEWYARHPEGRITSSIVEFTEGRVTVRAEAFTSREPNEPPAGTGHSFLAIPGSTPYTKGSELENAETSAAGRALVLAGIPSKNVASANEVRAKKSGPVKGSTPPAPAGSATGESTASRPGAQAAQDAASPASVPEAATVAAGDSSGSSSGSATQADSSSSGPDPNSSVSVGATGEQEGAGPEGSSTSIAPYGEGGNIEEGPKGPAPTDYITKEVGRELAKALGGQAAVLKLARQRFGTNIHSVVDLTRAMAKELVDAR